MWASLNEHYKLIFIDLYLLSKLLVNNIVPRLPFNVVETEF